VKELNQPTHRPPIRAQPQITLRVFQDSIDVVSAEADRVRQVMAIDGKGIRIVLIEPVLRADPQEALAILQNRIHAALR
jgi:hypothetical protein